MDDRDRIPEKLLSKVLSEAAKLQSEYDRKVEAESRGKEEGYSLEEIEKVAAEAGISPEFVEAAAIKVKEKKRTTDSSIGLANGIVILLVVIVSIPFFTSRKTAPIAIFGSMLLASGAAVVTLCSFKLDDE